MGDAPPSDPDAPLVADLHCPQCSYNLRGLSGDPIRCPECGYIFARKYLVDEALAFEQRYRELGGALGIQTQGALLLLAALGWLFLLPSSLTQLWGALGLGALVLVGVAGIGSSLFQIRTLARQGGAAGGWGSTLILYQLTVVGRVAAAWSGAIIGPAVALGLANHGFSIRLVLGSLVAIIALHMGAVLVWSPSKRLREWQERYYMALVRATRSGSVPEDTRE